MNRTVYIVAGEVSGDMHGAEVMQALPGVTFHGLGGARMAGLSAGVRDWVDDAAVMGIGAVLRRYPWFKEQMERMVEEVVALKPAVLLLVDYQGFNLRLATRVKARLSGTTVIQYVAPQVWAWNQRRMPRVVAAYDRLICLFPFEVEIFQKAGLPSVCLGHPLVDELRDDENEKGRGKGREKGLIALLPGSRVREVTRIFPVLLEVVKRLSRSFPELRFETAAATHETGEMIVNYLKKSGLEGRVVLSDSSARNLMRRAELGVVASGTATLEAAMLGLPFCLIYRTDALTWLVARQVVRLNHIGLANILAGREVVPEFLQQEGNAYEVAWWLAQQWQCPAAREALSEDLRQVAQQLGKPGVHDRIAAEVEKFLPPA